MSGLRSPLGWLLVGLAESYALCIIIKLSLEKELQSMCFASHSVHQAAESVSLPLSEYANVLWHTISRRGWIARDGVIPHPHLWERLNIFIYVCSEKNNSPREHLFGAYIWTRSIKTYSSALSNEAWCTNTQVIGSLTWRYTFWTIQRLLLDPLDKRNFSLLLCPVILLQLLLNRV